MSARLYEDVPISVEVGSALSFGNWNGNAQVGVNISFWLPGVRYSSLRPVNERLWSKPEEGVFA